MLTQEVKALHQHDQHVAEQTETKTKTTLTVLVDNLRAVALTEEEYMLAGSAAYHADLFKKKWQIHLQERLLEAQEANKRFPTLQGYNFIEWASFGGPSPFEEKDKERFIKARVLGREIVKNGRTILPTIDYINRVLYSINVIGSDQNIADLADKAMRNPQSNHRWMEHITTPVNLPTPQGDELLIDVNNRTVDLLLPINTLPQLTEM
jgi:hypothetical protein